MLQRLRLGALATALLFATSANATIIMTFDGSSTSSNTTHTGASAFVAMDFSDVVGGIQLDLTITNTTGLSAPFGAGATTSKLTGIGFDLPGMGMLTASLTMGGSSLGTYIQDADFPPFDTLDLAIADNGNFIGGNANFALEEGNTDIVSFLLIGAAQNAAGVESVFATGLADGSLDSGARFQQVNAGAGSDKLSGCCTVPPVVGVSEPGTIALFSLGFLALGFARRRTS